jgi:uncharacterized protein (UPF0335 family)
MPLGGSNDAPADELNPEQLKQLKTAAERLDYALDQITNEQDTIKATLALCKSHGLHSATIRKAVMLRRKRRGDPSGAAEAEDRLATYEAALE